MASIEERLRGLLDEKDAEIERLSGELSEANEKADVNWKWFAPDEMKDDLSPGLPVPRLEIRFTEVERDSHGYTIYIRYDLIRRHLCDQIVRTPLGGTHTTGSLDKRLHGGRIDLPFRDGAHIMHDAAHLQLPAFAILGDRIEDLSAATGDYSHQTKMGRSIAVADTDKQLDGAECLVTPETPGGTPPVASGPPATINVITSFGGCVYPTGPEPTYGAGPVMCGKPQTRGLFCDEHGAGPVPGGTGDDLREMVDALIAHGPLGYVPPELAKNARAAVSRLAADNARLTQALAQRNQWIVEAENEMQAVRDALELPDGANVLTTLRRMLDSATDQHHRACVREVEQERRAEAAERERADLATDNAALRAHLAAAERFKQSVDCACGHNGASHREEEGTGAARECTIAGCDCSQFCNVHMCLQAALADVARLTTERAEARGKAMEEAARYWQRVVDLYAPAEAMRARCDHDAEGPCEDCIRALIETAKVRALAAKGGA